jgi:hypothetical protein
MNTSKRPKILQHWWIHQAMPTDLQYLLILVQRAKTQWHACVDMSCGKEGGYDVPERVAVSPHFVWSDLEPLVLAQLSFYPLFPAPTAPPLEPLNLDVTHSNLLRFDQGTGADIFIMPSMLKHFAKVVDSAVMINPATVTRKNQPGTFVKMTIYPTPQRELEEAANTVEVDEADDEKMMEHRIYERVRVDIVRV